MKDYDTAMNTHADHIRHLLPLAKGYAERQPYTPSIWKIIEQAEASLEPPPPKAEEEPSPDGAQAGTAKPDRWAKEKAAFAEGKRIQRWDDLAGLWQTIVGVEPRWSSLSDKYRIHPDDAKPSPAWTPKFRVGQRVKLKLKGGVCIGTIKEVINDRETYPHHQMYGVEWDAPPISGDHPEAELEPYTEPTPTPDAGGASVKDSDGWMELDTAPRDRTQVELLLTRGGTAFLYWSDHYSVFGQGGCWTDGLCTMGDKIDVLKWRPIDWKKSYMEAMTEIPALEKAKNAAEARAREAEAKCAEMRDWLSRQGAWHSEDCANYCDPSKTCDCGAEEQRRDIQRLLSSDCGKDFVPRAELDEALAKFLALQLKWESDEPGRPGHMYRGLARTITTLCNSQASSRPLSLHITELVNNLRVQLHICRVALGVGPQETIPEQTPKHGSILVDHGSTRKRISPIDEQVKSLEHAVAESVAELMPLRKRLAMAQESNHILQTKLKGAEVRAKLLFEHKNAWRERAQAAAAIADAAAARVNRLAEDLREANEPK